MNADRERPPASGRQAGFTLLEVLAALSVFLVGVIGVLSLLTSGTTLHHQAERLSGAMDIVGSVVLEVEQELPAVDLGGAVESQRRPVPWAEGYFYQYQIHSTDGYAPFLLDLEISWMEGGQMQSYRERRVLSEAKTWAQQVQSLRRS